MRILQAVLLCLTLTACSGCHESTSSPPAFRVVGRLFVDNHLAPKACIAFHPVDKVKSQGRLPVAITRSDGSFELTTYTPQDGAPEGDYTVTVTWPDASMPEDDCECIDPIQHDRLGGKYADPLKSSLLVTILPQDNLVNLSAEGARSIGLPNFAAPPRRGHGKK